MKTAALYARVSSEQQAKQATIESQVDALLERAGADGVTVLPTDIYRDEGYSGATLVRPALEQVRDRAAAGELDVLYVHAPDRLARKYAYQALLIEELSRAGSDVVFVCGPQGDSPEDTLLVQVQGMIAEYERARIIERCRRGKLHRARQGSVNVLSGAPYGYLYVPKTDHAPARYEILLPEARIVRNLFDWYVREQLSIGACTRRLNETGVPTRRGAAGWDRTTVWGILKNPAYMGKAAFGKTEVRARGTVLRRLRGRSSTPRHAKSSSRQKDRKDWITIDVPALVSEELYQGAAEQLERNKRLSKRNGRGGRYLLQGLVVCGACGYAYYGKTVSRTAAKGRVRWAYYRCLGTDAYRFGGKRICDNKQLRVDQLDGHVWDEVVRLMREPELLVQEWSQRIGDDGADAGLRSQRQQAQRRLARQEARLRRLVDAYEAGVLALDELRERSAAARQRVASARDELTALDAALREQVQLREVITRLEEFADRVRDGLDELDWDQRQQLVRTLVARVEIDENGANVVFRVPSERGGSNSEVGGGDGRGAASSESLQLRGKRDGATLRCAFFRRLYQSVRQDHVGLEHVANEPEYAAVLDPLVLHACQQSLVVDPVEELRQVNVHHPLAVVCYVLACRGYCRVTASPRSEAVARIVESRFEMRTEHLVHGLLDDAVDHVRDAKTPFSTSRLRNPHTADHPRSVAAIKQRSGKPRQQRVQVFPHIIDALPVGTGRALVGRDLLKRDDQVSSMAYLLHCHRGRCSSLPVQRLRHHAGRSIRRFQSPGPGGPSRAVGCPAEHFKLQRRFAGRGSLPSPSLARGWGRLSAAFRYYGAIRPLSSLRHLVVSSSTTTATWRSPRDLPG